MLKVNSSAMEPTLVISDRIIVDNAFYPNQPPTHNDLVALRRSDYLTIKRVIAVSGDTIEVKNRQVMVNGHVADEPFIQHSFALGASPEMDSFGPFTIPAGKLFVMGDNRDVSLDCRIAAFGLVDIKAITGRPLYIYRSSITGRAGEDA